jgi:uncharacterized protein (TIGR03083 family)
MAGMEKSTYLDYLDADYRRLREVATGVPDAPVPSCPGWTMTDLVKHVAEVYVDKTRIMRTGVEQQWPPELAGGSPLDALEVAYRELAGELAARKPDEPALTWYLPEQKAGFWMRRMAQETVIHRVDAELAAGAELAPIPDDLAVDGIDEVLVCFLSFASHGWPQMFADHLAGRDGAAVSIEAGAGRWSVALAESGVDVSTGVTGGAATVSGSPAEVLLWAWRRAGDETVRRAGDLALIDTLRTVLGDATV